MLCLNFNYNNNDTNKALISLVPQRDVLYWKSSIRHVLSAYIFAAVYSGKLCIVHELKC